MALLRGINVGGKNRLPMGDLVSIFDDLGCTEVESYIQSGNVIYRAPSALAKRIPALVATAIDERFGLDVPVVTRTAGDLRKIVDRDPFSGSGLDSKYLSVGFLARRPFAAAVRKLDPERSPPDSFEVRDREIYLRCSNGVARSKLTNRYFDTTLGTTSTFRNWNTVLKLLELAELA